MLLKSLIIAIISLMVFSTLTPSLYLNIHAKVIGWGRETVGWVGVGSLTAPIVAVALLAISSVLVEYSARRRMVVSAVLCTFFMALFFSYDFYTGFQSAVTTRENERQIAATSVSGEGRRVGREDEIQKEMAVLIPQLARLDSKVKAARRIAELTKERQGLWKEITRIEDNKAKVDPRTKYQQIAEVWFLGTPAERKALNPDDVTVMLGAMVDALMAELSAMLGPVLILKFYEFLMAMTGQRAVTPAKPAQPKPQIAEKVKVPALSTEAQWQADRTIKNAGHSPKASELQADFDWWCRERGFEKPKRWQARLKEHLIQAGFPPVADGRNIRYPGLGLTSVQKLRAVK